MGKPIVNSRSTWVPALAAAIEAFLKYLPEGMVDDCDIQDTPQRVVKAFGEYFAGCHEDPKEVLTKGFDSHGYDEMVFNCNIPFVSFCAHHLVPFMGRVHFAYIPDKKLVGLSKIPRLVECFAKRPQLQERLTQEIVDTFQTTIQPHGCGVVVEAVHLCMAIRGVKKEGAFTKTQAIRGCFKAAPEVKYEFLDGVNNRRGAGIWP